MDKVENGTSELGKAERILSNHELDAVTGGFVIYGAEVRGFVVNWAASCSNNLREGTLQLGG